MAEPSIWFEDLEPGETVTFGTVSVSEEDIVAFAQEWDPQPMHLSEEAGRDTLLGRLTASGWHVCCIMMRMMCEGYLLEAASRGAPGIDEVRWIEPVLPGDTLTGKRTVLEKRRSRSRPDLGVVRCRYEMVNQHGKPVMTATFPAFIGCREPVRAAL